MTKILKSVFNFEQFPPDQFFITVHGRKVESCQINEINDQTLIHVHKRLLGGKGGFGSMLRAIGNQIEKTTNHEMCRDLSGRRMRDVNAEKKLKEWYEKAKPEEKEKAKLYLEKRRKRRELLEKGPNADFKFADKKFLETNEKISETLQNSIEAALGELFDENKKPGPSEPKRTKLWLDKIDYENLSSSDESSSNEKEAENPIDSNQDENQNIENTQDQDCQQQIDKTEDASDELKNSYNFVVIKEPVIYSQQPEIALETKKVEEQKKVEEPKPDEEIRSIPNEELKEIESVEKLMEFGLDILKKSLLTRGLKCGGSLEERASRLFSVRKLSSDQYPNKLRLPPPKR